MNRYNQLARLKDEVGRLFTDGLDENAVFKQLHANPRFDTVTRMDVQSFYKRMKEKAEIKEKHERKMVEIKRIEKLCQNADDYLFYNAAVEDFVNMWSVWKSRFNLSTKNAAENDDTHKVKLLDLFQNKSKIFEIPKLHKHCFVYTLTYPFLLFIDRKILNNLSYVRLARVDPENDSIQILQTINYNHYCRILVDSCNPSKFILMFQNGKVQICKLANGRIQAGEMREKKRNLYEKCYSYFENSIYDMGVSWNDGIIELCVLIWNLDNDETNTVELNSLSDNLTFAHFYMSVYSGFKWIRDQLFTSVKFVLTNDFGIVYADLQTKNWTLVNFANNNPIKGILFVSNNDLAIRTEEFKDKVKFYKLPLCRPDLLRNMAWLKVVNLFKQAKIEDPYKEARRYLPLNSDIQPFIFTEE